VGRLGDCAVGVAGLLGWVEELHRVGHDLEPGAALPLVAGPLVEVQPAGPGSGVPGETSGSAGRLVVQ